MKLFAAFFSFYILFLTVSPSFLIMKVEKKEHCRKERCHASKPCEKKSDHKKEKSCPKGQCTPFFGCVKVQVVIPSFVVLSDKQPVQKKTFAFFVESYSSASLASIWHPPQVS
ncbi:MAG: hypothetical protein NT126_03540 [Bacteroidetes bacterium]|nr:hypothetical protein [Bacteroidota bacterium]